MRPEDVTEIVVGGSTNELKVFVEARSKIGNMQKVVYQTYDRKMRQIRELQTKQQVIEKCQDLLVTKTLEYMNLMGETESHHLKALQKLSDIIDKKDFALFEREKEIRDLKGNLESREEEIAELHEQIQRNRQQLVRTSQEHERHKQVLLANQQKQVQSLKSKEAELVDKSEQDRRALFKKMDATNRKMEQVQLEMSLLTQNKDKEIKEAVERKVLEIETKQERVVSGLQRHIKSLEASLQTTTKKAHEEGEAVKKLEFALYQIKTRKEKFITVKLKHIAVKPTPPPRPPSPLPLPPPTQSPKKVDKPKQDTPRTTPRVQPKKMTNRQIQCYMPPKSAQKSPNQKPQQSPTHPPGMTLTTVPKKTSTFQIATEIVEGQIEPKGPTTEQLQKLTEKLTDKLVELEDSLTRSFNTQKAELVKQYEGQIKHIHQQHLLYYQQAYKTVAENQQKMEALHREELAVEVDRYNQLERYYLSRPSRQQDIDYIKTLTDQNLELAGLCADTNDRLNRSYEVLKECQQNFDKFRDSLPMDLKGVGDQFELHHHSRTLKTHESSKLPFDVLQRKSKRLSEPTRAMTRINSTTKPLYRSVRRHTDYRKSEQEVIQDLMQSILVEQQRPPRRVHTSAEARLRRAAY